MDASLLNLAVSRWQGAGAQISVQSNISALRVVTDTVNGFMERIPPSVTMDRDLWADSLKEAALDMVTRVSPFQAADAAGEGSVRAFLDGLKSSKMNSRTTTPLGGLPPASEAMLKGLSDLFDADDGRFRMTPNDKGSRHVVRAEVVGGFLFGFDLFVEESSLGMHVNGGFVYPRSTSHWREFLDPMHEDIPVISELSARRYFDLTHNRVVVDPIDEVWIVGSLKFLKGDEKRNSLSTRVYLERPLSSGKGVFPPYQLEGAHFSDHFSLDVDLDAGNESDAASIRKVSRHLSQHVLSFREAHRFFSQT